MFLMMAEVLELRKLANAFPKSDFWNFLAWHQTHVDWAGCSLHDLIQPSFSFLVGVALPFSIASRLAKGQSRWAMFGHACWRALVLVLLGVFLRSMYKKETYWTFEDTLSQIGLGYVPLFLLAFTRQRWQWIALLTILLGYWAAFVAYPLPPPEFDYSAVGVPADWKYHYSDLAAHWNKNSNLAWAFDTWFLNLFPRSNLFTHNGGGYATLSFIPTLATMILGLLAGGWLKRGGNSWRTAGWLILTGGILLASGLAFHENGLCPCVKRIWTPSWVLYSGGWCFLFLAFFYAFIDAVGWFAWSFPLRVIGANSIAAYLLAHGPDAFIIRSFKIHFGPDCFELLGAAYEPLVAGLAVLAIQYLILWWLYRQKIFIRI
jgi:heparan-alpha-glucosaminide N-acetyltransferase